MPPKRTESSRNSAHQEGRLLLAIQAIKNKEISSVRQAAEQFHIARTTLQRRLTGHTFRTETRANSYKLTQIEEETLKKRIISIDDRGSAPTHLIVKEMADLLLAARGTTSVGQKWVYNFIKRTPEL
jgi:hypothetical protein